VHRVFLKNVIGERRNMDFFKKAIPLTDENGKGISYISLPECVKFFISTCIGGASLIIK
jgi:hypothetical protein